MRISIIIPTYNRGALIRRAINSILKQSYKEFELIIIDDYSTDNTEEIVKSIQDDRIRYVKLEKNCGANKARNIGVDLSKYELIAFQDSDDEWHSDKLEKQLKYLVEGNFDIVSCKLNQYLNDKFKRIFPTKNIVDSNKLLDEVLNENFISTQTILGKKECFLKERFDNSLPRFQDWELAIRLVNKYKVGFYNKSLVNVFIQSDSISKDSRKACVAMEIIYNNHYELISRNKFIESEMNKKIYLFKILNNESAKSYIKKSLLLKFDLLKLCLMMMTVFKLEVIYRKYNQIKWGKS